MPLPCAARSSLSCCMHTSHAPSRMLVCFQPMRTRGCVGAFQALCPCSLPRQPASRCIAQGGLQPVFVFFWQHTVHPAQHEVPSSAKLCLADAAASLSRALT